MRLLAGRDQAADRPRARHRGARPAAARDGARRRGRGARLHRARRLRRASAWVAGAASSRCGSSARWPAAPTASGRRSPARTTSASPASAPSCAARSSTSCRSWSTSSPDRCRWSGRGRRRRRYVDRWTDEERAILAFRPGITGPTQIAYIDEEELLAGRPERGVRVRAHARQARGRPRLRAALSRCAATSASCGRPSSASCRPASAGRTGRGAATRSASGSPAPGSGPILLDAFLAAIAAALAVGLRIDRNNIFAAVATYWVFVPLAAIVRPAGLPHRRRVPARLALPDRLRRRARRLARWRPGR